MELRHLRYFVAVADALSFTRAATQLGIGQPPLSQQIQQLEREIGSPLFVRLPRGIRLTDVGEAFLEEAQTILRQTATAIDHAQRVSRGEIGLLRLGFAASATFHPFVPAFVRAYRASYPDVRIALVEGHTRQLTGRLADRTLDLALIRPPYVLPDDFWSERVVDEDMLAVLPNDHRLHEALTIDLAHLKADSFILFPRHISPGLHDNIVRACINAGFTPRIDQEAPQMTSIIHLVGAGLGVAIVPASMRKINAVGVVYKPLAALEPRARLDLVHHAVGASAATLNAVSMMKSIARRYGPRSPDGDQ